MELNSNKDVKWATNTNCEDSSLKIYAENFNDYFLKIAKNISDKINNSIQFNLFVNSIDPI
jgi:hypothetical protein